MQVAVDTSILIAYFKGETGSDVDWLDTLLPTGEVAIPPVVLTEIFSRQENQRAVRYDILKLPFLEPKEGFWLNAARLRAAILQKGLKARVADAMIAQSCLEYDVPLLTRDTDFRHFAEHCGLRLAVA